MTFFRLCAVAAIIALMNGAAASGQALLESLTSNLNIEGLETTYDPETGLATAKGDVRVSYGDVEIRCGHASYNATTGEVIARENVVVWKAGTTYKGDTIIYNANTGELSGDMVRSSMPLDSGTIFYQTEKFEADTKLIDKIEGENAFFTTHDLKNPNFRLRARHLTIYPDDRVVLKNVTVYAGDTPIFYLPHLSQPLKDEIGYRATPGYTSSWGAFLLSQYGVIHGDHTIAKYRLDLRSHRGVAVGADFISMRHKANQENFGTLKLYYLNDINTDTNRNSSVARMPVDNNRYRVNFQHRIYLPGPEKSTWYLDFDVNKVSDIHFYEDFFFNDFRETPDPENQISLVHTDPAYLATLMSRFQLNDFSRVGEKLPEASIDFTRRELWDSGIYHQGTISAGFFREAASDLDPMAFAQLRQPLILAGTGFLGGGFLTPAEEQAFRNLLGLPAGAFVGIPEVVRGLGILSNTIDLPSFARLHTYQELLYPKTFFGWLNVVPRVGAGITHYSNIDGSLAGLPRSSDPAEDDTKPLFHAGVDVSFKITRTWPDFQMPGIGLDGLRHIVQPYLNHSYLDADQSTGFPSIDRLSQTTRPRSIDVPLFTAVDDLRSWHITRVGLRNTLQTRRDYNTYRNGVFGSATTEPTQTYTWAGLNTYVDLFHDDPEFDRDISNLYNELFWRPVPWISFWLDSQTPVSGTNGFTELNHGITLMPISTLSLTLGHQFIDGHPYFGDSNLVTSRIYARLNENWGFSMNHIFEIDDGTMEFQSYSVTRDLSSWIASIGAMVRNSRNGVSDYGVLFSLTLKDFPQVNIPLDIDPNPAGRGGTR